MPKFCLSKTKKCASEARVLLFFGCPSRACVCACTYKHTIYRDIYIYRENIGIEYNRGCGGKKRKGSEIASLPFCLSKINVLCQTFCRIQSGASVPKLQIHEP